jgi:hypothetical protein
VQRVLVVMECSHRSPTWQGRARSTC